MKRFFFFLIVLVCSTNGISQSIDASKLGFEEHAISTTKLGNYSYYIFSKKGSVKKPLLVYLEGSGAYPMFQGTSSGLISTIPFDYQGLSKNFHLLFIGKPSVPFYDKVNIDKYGKPVYKSSSDYIKRFSKDWRVDATVLAIEAAKKIISVSEIYLFGFSEGAQVVPFVAKKLPEVSKIILMGGNGLNQLFDPIINARQKALVGQLNAKQAQKEVDSLFRQYKDIYRNPESTKKHWWGHTYKRWSSFTAQDPVFILLTLDIDIYMANGTLDENSILSADYIQLEFIKHKKDNLTYKAYPNYDHGFNELKFENGNFVSAVSRLDNVIDEAINWLNKK